MANENVTIDDVKANAEAKAEEAKETVKEKFEALKELPLNQKVLLVGLAALGVSFVAMKIGQRRAKPAVVEQLNVIVTEDQILDHS